MKTAANPHTREVLAIINSVEDRDLQNELLEISSKYGQVLAGLRIAKNHLIQIDEEMGTDHSDTFRLIYDAINIAKQSELTMLAQCSEI